jgi:hypothetical protein
MFGLIGFDTKSMSDEELLKRNMELQDKLVWANRFGSVDLVGQIQTYLFAIESERQQRVIDRILAERNTMMADVIESDPDLRSDQKREEDAKPTEKPKRTAIIARSDKPVIPTNEPKND